MTELEIIMWFLFGVLVGAAIVSVFWKVYIEDRFHVQRD